VTRFFQLCEKRSGDPNVRIQRTEDGSSKIAWMDKKNALGKLDMKQEDVGRTSRSGRLLKAQRLETGNLITAARLVSILRRARGPREILRRVHSTTYNM
jgi:hypothetical protein